MNALRDYRDEIKKNAKDPKAMFEISDNLRDDILPQLGIRLDDKGQDKQAIWVLEDVEVLLKERQKKIDDKLAKE